METKFTKAKEKSFSQYIMEKHNQDECIGFIDGYEKALKDSKAPEMFEEIKESITDLKILKTNILQSAKLDNKWDGFSELIQKWIDKKEQLLKEATEI